MTESEWLESKEPETMIRFLLRPEMKPSRRKLRLFACACCRRVEPFLSEGARAELANAELVADGKLTEQERRTARDRAFHVDWVPDPVHLDSVGAVNSAHARGPAKAAVTMALTRDPADAALYTRNIARSGVIRLRLAREPDLDRERADLDEHVFQANLLRDLIGNPFRPIPPDPAWLTSDVVDLVRTIYEDRTFEILPILADALMDAGCDDATILDHCRSDGPHALGCWIVDMLLKLE